jgi:hypothetical protein
MVESIEIQLSLPLQIQKLVLDTFTQTPNQDLIKYRASLINQSPMWTVLAAFVATYESQIDVITICTGTKSIGKKQMCK